MERLHKEDDEVVPNREGPSANMVGYTKVIDGMKDVTNGVAKYKKMNEQRLFDAFKDRCKNSLHLILIFSPIGEDFKRRIRIFPSLVT